MAALSCRSLVLSSGSKGRRTAAARFRLILQVTLEARFAPCRSVLAQKFGRKLLFDDGVGIDATRLDRAGVRRVVQRKLAELTRPSTHQTCAAQRRVLDDVDPGTF